MAIVSNTVGYLDDDVLLEAFFSFDDSLSGRRPAVLINHTWAGRDEFVAEKAKKLKGSVSSWRIRSGDYRILYEIDDSQKLVKVYRIAHRKEAYR